LSSAGECRNVDGGIAHTYLTEFSNITAVTYDADGNITNFTMGGVGQWVKYSFDTDDDTASYNQEGQRDGNKHSVTQTAFFKFGGVTNEMVKFANDIKECCQLVAIHRLG